MQRFRSPRQREDNHEVEEHEGGEADENAGEEFARVATKDVDQRQSDGFGAAQRFGEDRRLREGETNVEAEQNEQSGGEEWKTPAEGEELFLREEVREKEEDGAGEQEADGGSELWEHSVEGALARRGVFDGKQDSAAPFAAEADALAEAAERKQQRRDDTDG